MSAGAGEEPAPRGAPFEDYADFEEEHSGLPGLADEQFQPDSDFYPVELEAQQVQGTVIRRNAGQAPAKAVAPHRFRCTVAGCGKAFDRQRSLKYHSITHAPPIYACSVCKKAFVTMPKLKRHMLIHNGQRPFVCAEPGCGKAFSTNSNLNVHRRQHTGEKPFACSVCGRQFAHHSHAKAHLKVHQRRAEPSGPHWAPAQLA